MERFGEIAPLHQIGKSLQKLADVNGRRDANKKSRSAKTAIEMMLQTRIGHISSRPFWM